MPERHRWAQFFLAKIFYIIMKVDFLNKVTNLAAASKTAAKTKSASIDTAVSGIKNDAFEKACEIRYYFDDSKCVVFGDFPKNYVDVDKVFVEAQPERFSRFTKKLIPAVDAHWDTVQTLKPNYYIEHLFSHAKGQGSEAVKNIVKKSLEDSRTQGRVVIHCDVIDGKTSPAGFYYKLGFRFPSEQNNTLLKNWLEKGGQRQNAPMMTGMMYLPSENITHCLNY